MHKLSCSHRTSNILKRWCAGDSTIKFSFNYSDSYGKNFQEIKTKEEKKETKRKPKKKPFVNLNKKGYC